MNVTGFSLTRRDESRQTEADENSSQELRNKAGRVREEEESQSSFMGLEAV